MTLKVDALAGTPTADAYAVHKEVEMTQQKTWTFGAVAADETVETCYPVGFNSTTGDAAKWMAPAPTVVTVSVDGTIVVNGVATASIDVSADTEAIVAAKLLAIGIKATVSEASDVFTVTLDGDAQVSVIPTVTAASNVVVDGTSSYGTHNIKGIVWPEPIDLDDALEVQKVCMVEGNVDFDELEAVVAAGDVTALKAACREDLLPRGLNVQNLTQVR